MPTTLANPPRPVDVLHDGAWVSGWLEAYRRNGDGWLAYVGYSVGVGMQHLKWVTAERVGPA